MNTPCVKDTERTSGFGGNDDILQDMEEVARQIDELTDMEVY
jgi:hypothetical protein